jgi:hypothetical protein
MTQASEDNGETEAIGGNRSVVRENSVRLQSHHILVGRSFQKQQAQTLSPGFHSHSRYRPAQALAKFFTLLEQKKLVSEPACSEMNDLLDGSVWRRAYSYLGYGIPLSGKACTKIGFLDAEHGLTACSVRRPRRKSCEA